MIRMVMMGRDGPIVLLGITEENVTRLKAGKPIDVDLRALMRGVPDDREAARLVVSYGARHVDVVQDLERGGLPVTPALHEQARALDEQLERERGA